MSGVIAALQLQKLNELNRLEDLLAGLEQNFE
jgi:hypothetical protein